MQQSAVPVVQSDGGIDEASAKMFMEPVADCLAAGGAVLKS